jgi:hypothetical protein
MITYFNNLRIGTVIALAAQQKQTTWRIYMRNSLRLVAGLTLLIIFLCPRNGLAVTIDSTSDDFTVNWLLTTGQGAPIDLNATATFDVTTVATNGSGLITSIAFNVHFSNTTVLSSTTAEAGITTFGFGTNPNATTVTFTDNPDGAFAFAEVQTGQQNFPGGSRTLMFVSILRGVLAVRISCWSI